MILVLDAETEIDAALHALARYFAEDRRCAAVRLQVQGKPLGYLNRGDFFSAPTGTRLGEAQGAQLPGSPAYSFIRLACPVEGCETLVLKIHYDEQDTPRCPRHPDKVLQIVT
ncbi:hypothetical protein [Candidatus Thiosymbion oneisti]|uniref:hypothetical protein n=1 Tax=Candidatus Thiosymbion oneisti TaxID=589554 RepID=UPI000B7E4F18|nr:hypothetical protein [Candidatus Thiosymbion oneisti]